MIENLKYKYTLWRLRKNKHKISKKLEELSAIAKTPDDYAEGAYINQEKEAITNWIEYLQTKYYCNVCHNLLIPIPNQEDKNLFYKYDFDDEEGEKYIFTSIGFHYIRKFIRDERKEKREAFGYWITIIIGILGALTGLISIIKS